MEHGGRERKLPRSFLEGSHKCKALSLFLDQLSLYIFTTTRGKHLWRFDFFEKHHAGQEDDICKHDDGVNEAVRECRYPIVKLVEEREREKASGRDFSKDQGHGGTQSRV